MFSSNILSSLSSSPSSTFIPASATFTTNNNNNNTSPLTTTHIQLSPLTQVYHIIMSTCGYDLPNLALLLNSSVPSLSSSSSSSSPLLPPTPSGITTDATTTVADEESNGFSSSSSTTNNNSGNHSSTSASLELLRVNMCVPCNAIVLMNRCWNLLYTTDTQSNPDLASVLSPTVSTSPPISALSLHSIALACLHLSCKFHENLINLSRIQSIYKQHAFLYYSSTSILDNSSITLNDPLFTNFINIADLYVISELEYYVLNIWLHYLPSSVKTTMNTLKDNKQNYISLHSDHSMDTGESAVFPPSLTTAYPPSSSTTTTVSTPFVQYYLQNYHKYLLSLPIIRAVQIQYPFEIIERQVLYLSSRLIQRFTLVSFLSATSAISSSSSSTPSVSSLVWPNFHNSTQDLSENVGYQYSNLLSTVVYPLSCLAYIYLPDIISDLVAIPYSIEGTVSTLSTTSGSMTTSGDVLFAIAIIYVSVYRMCNEPIEYVTNAIETGNSTSSLSNTSNDTMESSPSLGPTGSSSSSPVNSESSNNGGTFTTLQKENRIVWEEVYKWLLEFPFLWNELFNDTSLPLPSLIESKEDTSSDTMDSLKSQTFVTLVQELKILVQYIQ